MATDFDDLAIKTRFAYLDYKFNRGPGTGPCLTERLDALYAEQQAIIAAGEASEAPASGPRQADTGQPESPGPVASAEPSASESDSPTTGVANGGISIQDAGAGNSYTIVPSD